MQLSSTSLWIQIENSAQKESKEIAGDHNYTALVSPEGMSWTWLLTIWDMKIHTLMASVLAEDKKDLFQNEKIVFSLKE